MEFEAAIQILADPSQRTDAREADGAMPRSPGLYAIIAKDIEALPHLIKGRLAQLEHDVIYVGRGLSLHRRLQQDLRGKSNATFFRALGALLGYRPPKGSLIGKANKRNYKFSTADCAAIVGWIDLHLSVVWVENAESHESAVIARLMPPLNTSHNPEAMQEITTLRAECRRIAVTDG